MIENNKGSLNFALLRRMIPRLAARRWPKIFLLVQYRSYARRTVFISVQSNLRRVEMILVTAGKTL